MTGTVYEPDNLADTVEGFTASIISSFDMMLGDHDFEMCKASSAQNLCRFSILCNALIVNIVILNLLIALMSESVSRMQDTVRLHTLRERAELIVQYERAQSQKQRENRSWHPTFLHMLRPKHEAGQNQTAGTPEATLVQQQQSGQILQLQSQLDDQAKKLDDIISLLQLQAQAGTQ